MLKILFILSLGLGLNSVAQTAKTFTKNQKNVHSTTKSTQNQLLFEIEEEEIEEEVDQNKNKIDNVFPVVLYSSNRILFTFHKSIIQNYRIRFDIIKADKILHFLAFHNLRL